MLTPREIAAQAVDIGKNKVKLEREKSVN